MMQGQWRLTLLVASALLLVLALGRFGGLRGFARASAPVQELDAPAALEEPLLEQAPPASSAERRVLADVGAPTELESATPTEDPSAENFSLRVTLLELDGTPLAPGSADVLVADEGGQSFNSVVDEHGVASLTELAPGRWWVRGSAPGRITESREVHLPSTDAGLEVELRLAPRPNVRILVHTPDGRPFAEALPPGRTLPSATASRQRPEGWLGDALESPDWLDCGTFRGRVHTEPEPALLGRIELDCEPPLWVNLHLNEDVLESQQLQPGIAELRFVIDPDAYAARFAELVLRIVDADGARPLQGVMGHLHTGPRHSYIGISKSESGLHLKDLTAGRARLELSASGYDARLLEFTLQPGERKDLGGVELSRDGSGKLEVHVRGGEGVSDLKVNWTTEEELRNMERGATKAQFSAPVEGEMLAINLARGGWGVWASAQREGVELSSRLQLIAMEGGRVAVTLALEPVATLVLEPVGRPIDVWVSTPEGLLAHGTLLRVDDLPRRVELVPGSYTLLLHEEGREDRVQHLDLTPVGATIRVD